MNLLAAFNSIQQPLIAFYVVMVIVGFALVVIDKKRWVAHNERSADMMNRKAKRTVPETPAPEDADPMLDSTDIDKKEKNKKKVQNYEYEGRVKFKTFLIVGILFGAVGEVLATIFMPRKLYRIEFKLGLAALALLNIICGAILLYLTSETGESDVIIVNAWRVLFGGSVCIL